MVRFAWRPPMNNGRIRWIVVLPIVFCVTGCQATRTATRRIGKIAVAVPLFIMKGMFDSDETSDEKDPHDSEERKWKQFWRAHPNMNPAMHDAFKNDYR